MRVLIVDDNEEAAQSLALLLALQQHEVEVFGTGRDAIARVNSGPCDIVILDLELPDLNGCDVARLIRERHGDLTPRLIALTGHGDESDRSLGIEAGFDVFLVKPADPEDIFHALRTQLP